MSRCWRSLGIVAAFGVGGAVWGVVARAWMRLITEEPEFTWSGTLFIVGLFAVVATVQGCALAVRRRRWPRWAQAPVRVLAGCRRPAARRWCRDHHAPDPRVRTARRSVERRGAADPHRPGGRRRCQRPRAAADVARRTVRGTLDRRVVGDARGLRRHRRRALAEPATWRFRNGAGRPTRRSSRSATR